MISTISWINVAGGDWNIGANWSGGVVPTAADAAVIALPGTYDVASQNASNAVHSVTLNDPDASLEFNISTLKLGGLLLLDAGTFTLGGGGTIAGGTIDLAGGTFALFGSGTLAAATIEGALTLDLPVFSPLSIDSGLVLEGAGGVGPGTIDLLGGSLDFTNTQTVSGGAIVLGQSGVLAPSLSSISLEQSGPGVLTLAPSITVTAAGIAETIVGTVLNQDLISVLPGADLTINDSLINAGTVSIAPGGIITLDGSLSNAGTLIGTGGTIVTFGSVTVAGLQTLAASGAMVVLAGTLDNTGGTLSVGPGEAVPLLTLGGFVSFDTVLGEIDNGIVLDPTGSLITGGGTLSGVTYQGTLIASGPGTTILNGITLLDAAGTGTGLLDVESRVVFGSFTQAIAAGTITLGGSASVSSAGTGFAPGIEVGVGGPDTVLTLGSQAIVQHTGLGDDLIGSFVNQGLILASRAGGVLELYAGSTLTNQNLVFVGDNDTFVSVGSLANTANLDLQGGTLDIAGGSFSSTGIVVNTAGIIEASNLGTSLTIRELTSSGTLLVTGGAVATIGTLSSPGYVSVSGGGVLNLSDVVATWINETNATLNLSGSINRFMLNMIHRSGGSVALTASGNVDLTSGTLSVGGMTALGQLRDNGAIGGGTINDAGGGMVFYGGAGSLQDVTYQGLLNLMPAGSNLTVLGGLTLTAASGSGPGTANVLGAGSRIAFQNSQTLDNATLNIGSNTKTDVLAVTDATGTGAVLTLGTNANLMQRGAMAEIDIDRNPGDSLINHGLIGAIATRGSLLVQGGTFTNAGRVVVANGDTLSLEADQVSNLTGNVLNTGYWEVDANSTLNLGFDNPILNLNAAMVLNGPGSQVLYNNSSTFQTTSLEQTLNYVGTAGVLVLANGRAFNDPGLFFDAGQVVLSGGTLSGNPVAIGSTGVVYGAGTITAGAIYDSGHVLAQNGALVLNAPLLNGSPVGNALIAAGSTLVAEQTVAVPVQFLANTGTLALAQANLMYGSIFELHRQRRDRHAERQPVRRRLELRARFRKRRADGEDRRGHRRHPALQRQLRPGEFQCHIERPRWHLAPRPARAHADAHRRRLEGDAGRPRAAAGRRDKRRGRQRGNPRRRLRDGDSA